MSPPKARERARAEPDGLLCARVLDVTDICISLPYVACKHNTHRRTHQGHPILISPLLRCILHIHYLHIIIIIRACTRCGTVLSNQSSEM